MTGSVLRFAVGGLFVALMVGSTIYALARPTSGQSPDLSTAKPIHGIPCDQGGQIAVHYHAHLDIFTGGRRVTVPAGIGIPRNGLCLYWIHTHDTSGVIHIEAPAGQASRMFTLGDFLAIWGGGPTTHVLVIVNGRPYPGDPDGIVLAAHELITLETSPPEVPQPGFEFPQGL
jgi:hypothetical protein